MFRAQGECLYLLAGARESWDGLCLGLRLWDRKGQQTRLIAGFQQRGTCGHDGIIPSGSPDLPAGQRGQGRELPLLQPAGVYTPAGEIRCHLDSVGLWLVLHGIAFALLFPDKEDDTWD